MAVGELTPGPTARPAGPTTSPCRDPRSTGCAPAGWEPVAARGFGPFTTELTLVGRDGIRAVWDSRHHRKRAASAGEGTWWAPRALGWWMAVLFAVGSACFAGAAVPALAVSLGTAADNAVYFVGSVFFTTAGLLQYAQVVGADDPSLHGPGARLGRLATWQPHRIDWLAAAVQTLGTLFFNVTTAHALTVSATGASTLNHAVWRPDALGSVCFLVSSYLSWAEVSAARAAGCPVTSRGGSWAATWSGRWPSACPPLPPSTSVRPPCGPRRGPPSAPSSVACASSGRRSCSCPSAPRAGTPPRTWPPPVLPAGAPA